MAARGPLGRAWAWCCHRPVSRTWAWAKLHRISLWIVVFTAITVFSLWEADRAISRVERLARSEAHEDLVEEAEGCLSAWERLDGSREAIDRSINGVLILAFAVADDISPERRLQIEQAAGPVIRNAQDQIVEPACDRDGARERLRELQGAP